MTIKLWLCLTGAALLFPTASLAADRNHDGIPDRWEHRYHLSLRVDQAHRDQDRDKVANLAEYRDHLSPRSADSDGDGTGDAQEVPAPSGWSEIGAYSQTAGYGGPLTLTRTDGTSVQSYFGEKVDLRCGTARSGPFTTCGKENLRPGTEVVDAAHGPNDHGSDVWTFVTLVTPPGSADTPPAEQPAAEQAPAPARTGTVESFDAATAVLTVTRPSNDERPAAPVTTDTQIVCMHVRDGKLTRVSPCSTDQLVAGTGLSVAQRAQAAAGGWVWTKLYVLVPED